MKPKASLEYANQPVFENLLVTCRPGGVTIGILPFRPDVRAKVLRLVVVVVLAVGLLALAGYATARGGDGRIVALVATIVAFYLVTDGAWRLACTVFPSEMEADGTGLRNTKWMIWPWRWRVLARVALPRERVAEVVASRTPERSRKLGEFSLEIRLVDGVTVHRGYGTEREIRFLATILNEAMGITVSSSAADCVATRLSDDAGHGIGDAADAGLREPADQ